MSVYYMGSVQGLSQEMKSEVEAFLCHGIPAFLADGTESFYTVVLGSGQNETARLTVINLLKDSGLEQLYMQCNRQSQKVKNLLDCGKAEIAVTNTRGYVVLECSGEVVEDPQLKAEKWEDWMIQYHPRGCQSPDYVILRFTTENIRAII